MLSTFIRLLVCLPVAKGHWSNLHQSILNDQLRRPEAIEITSVALPPVVSSSEPGACSDLVNSHGTGCIGQRTGLQAGNFLPDGNHIVATIRFTGAPASPDPRSIYQGNQVIVLKVDDTLFPNGDSWKCITCGLSNDHDVVPDSPDFSYPQAFSDGRRILAGRFIVDCGEASLISEECDQSQTQIYPLRLENMPDSSGPGADLRELRLHPDNVHLGFNVFSFADGRLGQNAYIARLQFNASPTTGSNRSPRYDLEHVNQLYNPDASQTIVVEGDELTIHRNAISIGELRGFSGTGREVLYLGYPHESCNIDVFAADLQAGRVRRLTSHPGYVDPVQMSPDDGSMVIMDTRSNDRTTFMAGMRGIPPLADLVTTMACASVRNNGQRRFFQPYLLDRYGDREGYYGQEINCASAGEPGSGLPDDPEWNGRADPWFSPDGTKIVYWQAQTVSPACGGDNPLPCYDSTEPGGRRERIMIAHLAGREPLQPQAVEPMPDIIPWAVPYLPGGIPSRRKHPPSGVYTLKGQHSGHARVSLTENDSQTAIRTVAVSYHDFSDDGESFLHGTQRVTEDLEHLTIDHLEWHSNLTYRGRYEASQVTSEDGFRMSIDVMKNDFRANGTLKTILDGVEYLQPRDGQ